MEGIVTSKVVDEAVSRAASFVSSILVDKVSQKDLIERLEMVHIKLDLALERSRMMPITFKSLLRLRKKLKDVFEECDDLLSKARDREQVVPSLRRKIMHAVLPSFIVPNQDMLSSSVVGRFERFAEEADKFVRDMESGCSLSHHRFLNPLIRHLLEGKELRYRMVRGSKTCFLSTWSASVEDYGRVCRLDFGYRDRKVQLKSFQLVLVLRLHESTNIIGVTANCLQSLGPQFKSLAEVATGELIQVPTQDISYSDICCSVGWRNVVGLATGWSPDPFCCIANGLKKPCANNIISSELTGRFPQEVVFVSFDCHFSASKYCSRSSTDEARVNTTKAWPPLEMSVAFAPHLSVKQPYGSSLPLPPHSPIKQLYGSSLHQTEDVMQTWAIDYFIRYPGQTEYHLNWCSAHGLVIFSVLKSITNTRRGSKRRC